MTAHPARTRTPSVKVEKVLLGAAEQVLKRDGPKAVTIRAVAAEAKVAPMGVYSRFGGKEGLAQALRTQGFERLRQAVTDVDGSDAITRLGAAGIGYREFALANPHLYLAMFEDSMGIGPDALRSNESGDAAFNELVGHVRNVLLQISAPAKDPVEIAQQIWAAVHGAVLLEIKGLVVTPDPNATYLSLLQLLIGGVIKPAP